MPTLVAAGAQLKCDQGAAPASLGLLPRVVDCGPDVATIDDHQPTVNLRPFGMCRSLANPAVQAATVAAQGVLTPWPCLPVTPAPWTPGSSIITVEVDGRRVAALTSDSRCSCNWAGSISITDPACAIQAPDA